MTDQYLLTTTELLYNARCTQTAPYAGVVELVDTSDSKSDASNSVPVQVRPPVPLFQQLISALADNTRRIHSIQ